MTTFANVMLAAVLDELPKRHGAGEEPEVKAARRRKAEQAIRAACKADGLSDKFADDAVLEVRKAWHTGDTVDMVTALFFGGEKKA